MQSKAQVSFSQGTPPLSRALRTAPGKRRYSAWLRSVESVRWAASIICSKRSTEELAHRLLAPCACTQQTPMNVST